MIEAKRLVKRYGRVEALSGVDLVVSAGITGLLGTNGAGKTTFLRLVLGMETITSGTLSAFGLDTSRDKLGVRSLLGYSPEREAYFAGMNAVDTAYFAGRLSGLPHADALRRAHLALDFVGLEEARYRKVRTYSEGMKQKVKLAQAIVHDPKMVILDEPTSGLDPAGREEILGMIRSLYDRWGISVLFSTHILHDAQKICSAAVVLHEGKVVAQGALSDLMAASGGYHVRLSGAAGRFAETVAGFGGLAQPGTDGRWSVTNVREPRLIFRAAADAGISVRRLERIVPTLEEVFLNLVR